MILDELTWPEIDALDRGRVLPVCVLARRAAQSAPAAGDGPSIGTSSTRRAPIARPAAGTAAGRVGSAHHLVRETLSIRHTMLATIEIGQRRPARLPSYAVINIRRKSATIGRHPATDGETLRMVAGASYWSLAAPRLTELRETEPGGMGHACGRNLHSAPGLSELVPQDRAGATELRHRGFRWRDALPPVVTARSFSKSATAVWGSVGATAEKASVLAAITALVAVPGDAERERVGWPPRTRMEGRSRSDDVSDPLKENRWVTNWESPFLAPATCQATCPAFQQNPHRGARHPQPRQPRPAPRPASSG